MSPEIHQHFQRALSAAVAARERAYVPYSGFNMGAALVTSKGDMTTGALVENISFGLSMCAERVALFSNAAQSGDRPELLVLVAPRTGGSLTWPCGSCLQVAIELGGPDLLVVAADPDGAYEAARLAELAPRLPCKHGGEGE